MLVEWKSKKLWRLTVDVAWRRVGGVGRSSVDAHHGGAAGPHDVLLANQVWVAAVDAHLQNLLSHIACCSVGYSGLTRCRKVKIF